MSWKNPMFGDRHLVLNGNNNELKETCIFIFLQKKERNERNVSSFNKHFVLLQTYFTTKYTLNIWSTWEKCSFTFSDHNIDMGNGDNSEMFYAHWLTLCNDSKFTFACSVSSSDVFHFCKNITMDNNRRERNEWKVFIWQLKQ